MKYLIFFFILISVLLYSCKPDEPKRPFKKVNVDSLMKIKSDTVVQAPQSPSTKTSPKVDTLPWKRLEVPVETKYEPSRPIVETTVIQPEKKIVKTPEKQVKTTVKSKEIVYQKGLLNKVKFKNGTADVAYEYKGNPTDLVAKIKSAASTGYTNDHLQNVIFKNIDKNFEVVYFDIHISNIKRK